MTDTAISSNSCWATNLTLRKMLFPICPKKPLALPATCGSWAHTGYCAATLAKKTLRRACVGQHGLT